MFSLPKLKFAGRGGGESKDGDGATRRGAEDAGLGLNTGAAGVGRGRGLGVEEDDCWGRNGFNLLKMFLTLSRKLCPWQTDTRDKRTNTETNHSLILQLGH